jgi:hypothetical protein
MPAWRAVHSRATAAGPFRNRPRVVAFGFFPIATLTKSS